MQFNELINMQSISKLQKKYVLLQLNKLLNNFQNHNENEIFNKENRMKTTLNSK